MNSFKQNLNFLNFLNFVVKCGISSFKLNTNFHLVTDTYNSKNVVFGFKENGVVLLNSFEIEKF